MPLYDGTGPLGRGTESGHGKGGCCTEVGLKGVLLSGGNRKQGLLLGILLPLGTAILRDVVNPSGVIRRIVHVAFTPKITNTAQKTLRHVETNVLNVNSDSIAHRKKTYQ